MGYNYDNNKEWGVPDPRNEGFSFWMTIEGWRLTNFKKAAKAAKVEIRDTVDGKGMTAVWCKEEQDMTDFWDKLEEIEK